MVAVAIGAGIVAGATVTPPTEIPSVALGAVPVFRMEVGVAVFFGLYLAAMALVLALHNRAFTELGTGGFKARDLSVAEDAYFEEMILEFIDEFHESTDPAKGGNHGS
ncbi:MAG: hypothetical protein JST59_22130 [Actinobacteria bacterium]|nr:hypothetical protein [Actinomycetota bacterium]